MEKQRAKAAERARRKINREENPTPFGLIEPFEPEEPNDEAPETTEPAE
jgi:hypothetical protein